MGDLEPGDEINVENQSPDTLSYVYSAVFELLSSYGWYIVIAGIAIFYLRSKLSAYFHKPNPVWNHSADYTQYDSEEVLRRQEEMDAARRRMQEQHENMAQKYLEEQKKKEEDKRKQKIEDWNRHLEGKGYRSKVRVEKPDDVQSSNSLGRKTVYRSSDYNPLAGGSGGAGFRPSRRSSSRGG